MAIHRDRSCEYGCGCCYGTDDPDARDCACDGPCCYAPYEVWFYEGPYCKGHKGKRPRTVKECVADLKSRNPGSTVPCPFCKKLVDPANKVV